MYHSFSSGLKILLQCFTDQHRKSPFWVKTQGFLIWFVRIRASTSLPLRADSRTRKAQTLASPRPPLVGLTKYHAGSGCSVAVDSGRPGFGRSAEGTCSLLFRDWILKEMQSKVMEWLYTMKNGMWRNVNLPTLCPLSYHPLLIQGKQWYYLYMRSLPEIMSPDTSTQVCGQTFLLFSRKHTLQCFLPF